MAYEGITQHIPGLVSGADLSASTVQYKFVKLTGDRSVELCAAATDKPIGVLQAPTPTSAVGQAVTVCGFGLTKLQADASLSAGDLIGTSADGQADAKTPGAGSEFVVGTVIEVAGGTTAGNYITAFINCANPGVAS